MKLDVDWSQASTKRGAVWLAAGVIALVFIWFGKDGGAVMAVGASIAGGVGIAIKD